MTSSYITPASQDSGRSVGERAWHLAWEDAVVPKEFEFVASEVMLFDIQALHMGRRRTTFDQWNNARESSRHIEAFLQLFVVALTETTHNYLSVAADLMTMPGCAIKVFMETVLADEEYMRRSAEDDFQALERERVAKIKESWYGKDIITAEALTQRNMAGNTNSAMDRVQFMRGYDDRQVVSYRIWVMIGEQAVKMSAAILAIFEGCQRLQQQRTRCDTLDAESTKSKKRKGAVSETDNSVPLSEIVGPEERYKLVNEPTKLSFCVGSYLNEPKYINQQADFALSARNSLQNTQNELHPINVFDAVKYFARCERKRPDICMRQRKLSHYYNRATNTWSFTNARHTCVLVVPPYLWGKDLLHMYVPDYQRRTIEPRLNWSCDMRNNFMRTRRVADLGTVDDVRAVPAPASAEPQSQLPPIDDAEEVSDCSGREFQFEAAPSALPVVRPLAAAAEEQQFAEISSDDGEDVPLARRPNAPPLARLQPVAARAANGANRNGAAAEAAVVEETEEMLRMRQEREYAIMISMDFQDPKARRRAYELANANALGGTQATVLHEMRGRYYLGELAVVDALKDQRERTRERMKLQQRATDEYCDKATSPQANVSQPHQAMNSWQQQQMQKGTLRFLRKSKFIDPRLSLFAQHTIQIYADAEHLCGVHTSHDVLIMLYISSRSCLLHDRDRLRNNVLLYGEHATSKSFALTELCKKMLIPGTFVSITSQSRQAATTDTHTNDLVAIHEELQDCLINVHTKDSEMQDAFKDHLTRGASSRLLCSLTETNGRQQVICSSEKNMVVLCASNIRRENINPAIGDRMLLMNQVPRNRLGVSIAQTMCDAYDLRQEKSQQINEMQHDYYLRQVIHNAVEKQIMTGIVMEPHLGCFGPIYNRYEDTLKRRFSINVERRQMDQLRMLLRTCVIMQAIEWLYNSPAGPCFERDFDENQLHLLEPMLHDTEELVYFVLDMCRHVLVDPNQEALMEFIRTSYVPTVVGDTAPNLVPSTRDKAADGMSNSQSAAPAPPMAIVSDPMAPFFEFNKHRSGDAVAASATQDASVATAIGLLQAFANESISKSATAKKTDAAMEQRSLAGSKDSDCNYFNAKRNFKGLALKLGEAMKLRNFRRAMGAETIEQVLRDMSNKTLLTKIFKRTAPGQWPPVCEDPAHAKRNVSREQIRIEPGTGNLLLHSSFVFFERHSPHEAAVMACMNRFTPDTHFIAGRPHSDEFPHLAGVRRTVQNNTIPSVQIGTDVVPQQMSYNEFSTLQRLKQLGMPLTKANLRRFDPIHSDAYARSLPGAIVPNPMAYPDDPINTDKKTHARNAAVRRLAAAGKTHDSFGNKLFMLEMPEDEGDGDADDPFANFAADAYKRRRTTFEDSAIHMTQEDIDAVQAINLTTLNEISSTEALSEIRVKQRALLAQQKKQRQQQYDDQDGDMEDATEHFSEYSARRNQSTASTKPPGPAWRAPQRPIVVERTALATAYDMDEDIDDKCDAGEEALRDYRTSSRQMMPELGLSNGPGLSITSASPGLLQLSRAQLTRSDSTHSALAAKMRAILDTDPKIRDRIGLDDDHSDDPHE